MGVLKDLLASGALEGRAQGQGLAASPAMAVGGRVPLKALNPNEAVEIKPRIAHSLSSLDLEDAKRGAFRSKLEIGTLGSCSLEWPKRTRRPKQPTVIVRPSIHPEEVEKPPVLPCGVLGDLKPGIIGRIRDSKHVHSVIGAVLETGTLVRKRPCRDGKENCDDCSGKKMACKQVKIERPEVEIVSLEDILVKDELLGRLESSGRNESTSVDDPSCDTVDGSRSRMESCDATTGDKVVDEDLEDHQSMTRENFAAQSQSGPAAIWFKLVNQDIKGRISALKRSRRRVRTAIVAKDDIFMPPDKSGFLDVEDPEKAKRQYELQMDKWKALFLTMDSALGLEATQLENHWKNLQEMRCSCSFNKVEN